MSDATKLATVHQIAERRPRLELKTPFAHLVPPLTDEERRALDLELRDGQDAPVLVDEDGNILDGHNRYAILDGRVFTRVIGGLSPAEKEAFVFRKAVGRRNLTTDQRALMRERMRAIAFWLRAEDTHKNTQQRIADKLGVARETVRDWLTSDGAHADTGSRPDARVKFTPEQKDEAVRRVTESGEKESKVAVDLGMSQQSVSKAVVDSRRRIVGAVEPVAVPERETKRKVYSSELKANVIRRLSADESAASIALDLNISRQAISAFVEEHKLRTSAATDETGRMEGTRRVDLDKRDLAVLELHNQKIGSAEIARRLGIHPDSVSKSKARLGVAANSPSFKLWGDVVHATDSLSGSALAIEKLIERIEAGEIQATGEEILECCKSLGESIRVAKRLQAALKARAS